MSDLAIARAMGWTYDDVRHLPRAVHDVLVEELNKTPDDPE